MNTPKLLSILSSSVGNAEQARAGKAADPAHGLDFSKLLGERRNQSAPAANSRPSHERSQSRSAERSPAPDHNTRTQARSEPNQGNAGQGSTQAPRNTEPAAANPNTPANRDTASADTDSPRAGKAPNDTGDTAQATDNVAHGQDTAPNPSHPAAEPDAQANAELALSAAEAGLPGIITGQAPEPAALPVANADATATARTGTAGAGQALPHPAGQPHAEAGTMPAGQTNPTLAGLVTDADTADPAHPQAAALARNPAGAVAQATVAATPPAVATATTPATLPASPAEHPAAALATATSTGDTPTLPLPTAVPIDAAGTAASRSLQEFTAMVAAARATSGTALAPAMAAATTPATTMPGLMPGSLFSTQPFAQTLAGSPGIAATLGSRQWPTEFGQQFIRIAQTATGLGQVAELRLDPPDLGPLRITINLNDNVAHAVFSSPHAAVRQSVENALPQLQQMLEQAGISLGQANVNDQDQPGQGFQGETQNARQTALGSETGNASAAADGHGNVASRPADPDALVDTFA